MTADPPVHAGYSTEEAAQLFGLSPRRIRRFAASGVLAPARNGRGAFRFSFQDLVLLRAARTLVTARVPARRIHRVLRHLARQLPARRPLSGLRITADGDRVVVRDGGLAWNPESGQVQLDFLVSEVTTHVAPLIRGRAARALATGARLSADAWCGLGLELEEVSPAEARRAYHRCLEADPGHVTGHVQLGRLLQQGGEAGPAEFHYRAALEREPGQVAALFGLGALLEQGGRLEEAAEAYRRTVACDPDHREAHYNLALLYEQTGDHPAAVRHLRTCRLLRTAPRRPRPGRQPG